jgi:Spy/CpxP family protein refolding chaperone
MPAGSFQEHNLEEVDPMMKRMKGLGALALACALALGATSPSLAHGRPGGPEEGLRGGDLGVMRLMNRRALDELKLTASQMEQVRKLMDETRSMRKEHRDGTMRDLMRDVRDGRELDAAAKKKLADEMTTRVLDGTRALSRFHAILAPEQRAAVQEKIDRLGKFEGHGKRFAGQPGKEGKPGKQQPGMQGREGHTGFPMGRFSERLNLTDAQKARAEVLSESWEKPREARQGELLRLGREMGKRAFSASPDTRRLEADAKKMAGLAVDGISERARHMEQFRSMLTDEQKKLLDEGPMGRRPGKRSW